MKSILSILLIVSMNTFSVSCSSACKNEVKGQMGAKTMTFDVRLGTEGILLNGLRVCKNDTLDASGSCLSELLSKFKEKAKKQIENFNESNSEIVFTANRNDSLKNIFSVLDIFEKAGFSRVIFCLESGFYKKSYSVELKRDLGDDKQEMQVLLKLKGLCVSKSKSNCTVSVEKEITNITYADLISALSSMEDESCNNVSVILK